MHEPLNSFANDLIRDNQVEVFIVGLIRDKWVNTKTLLQTLEKYLPVGAVNWGAYDATQAKEIGKRLTVEDDVSRVNTTSAFGKLALSLVELAKNHHARIERLEAHANHG